MLLSKTAKYASFHVPFYILTTHTSSAEGVKGKKHWVPRFPLKRFKVEATTSPIKVLKLIYQIPGTGEHALYMDVAQAASSTQKLACGEKAMAPSNSTHGRTWQRTPVKIHHVNTCLSRVTCIHTCVIQNQHQCRTSGSSSIPITCLFTASHRFIVWRIRCFICATHMHTLHALLSNKRASIRQSLPQAPTLLFAGLHW
jgi:hypothetical protein